MCNRTESHFFPPTKKVKNKNREFAFPAENAV